MKRYVLVECPRCGKRQIALGRWRTRRCVGCGFRLQLNNTKRLYESDKPFTLEGLA